MRQPATYDCKNVCYRLYYLNGRNALQGLGYGLVPMLGEIFELAALIPIVPYYFYRMKKYRI